MAWERVANLAELDVGGLRRVEFGGEPICVVRTDEDAVKAVHDTCSHEEYSLSEGFIEDNEIECPLHGSMFNLDTGNPDSLPATKPIPVYAAKIEDEAVWVDVERQLNDAPVPRH